MLVVFGFLLTITFGFLLTLLIVPKMHPLGRLGASYVLGLGLLTLFMFFYSLVGYKFNLTNTFNVLLTPILILLFFTHKKIKSFGVELKSTLSFRELSKVERAIGLAISFLILYSLLCTLYWPVHSWDVLVLYDWRAISESATRMTIFFPPLIIFYIGISEAIEGVIKK